MKKLTKFISLALGALMMLGVGVGIKPMMEKADAAGTFNTLYTFTSSTPTYWSASNATANNNYYKVSDGGYFEGTLAGGIFGSDILDSDLTVTVSCGTFGTWSNPKSVTVTVSLLSSTDTVLSSNNATFSSLGSSEGTNKTPIVVSKPTQPENISKVRVTYSDFKTGSTLRAKNVRLACTIKAGSETPVSVEGVSLNCSEAELYPYETVTLVSTISPSNATNQKVQWSSDDANVATVTNGVVTALSSGTCTISVTTDDGGFSDTCDIFVYDYSEPIGCVVGNSYVFTSQTSDNKKFEMTAISDGKGTATEYSIAPEETYKLVACQGLAVNTISFKDSNNKYIGIQSLTENDYNIVLCEDNSDPKASWVIDTNGICNLAQKSKKMQMLSSGTQVFKAYSSSQKPVTLYYADPSPRVYITADSSYTQIGGNNIQCSYLTKNIDNVSLVSWSITENSDVGSIDSNGLFTPIKIGSCTISCQINGTYDAMTPISIKVYPTSSSIVSIADAIIASSFAGKYPSVSPYSFITEGTCSAVIDTSNFTITDGTNSINVFKYNHGIEVGTYVQVNGKVNTYESNATFTNNPSILRQIKIEYEIDGDIESSLTDYAFEAKTFAKPSYTPEKSGYTFIGWSFDGDLWDFENNTVPSSGLTNLTMTLKAEFIVSFLSDLNNIDSYAGLAYRYVESIGRGTVKHVLTPNSGEGAIALKENESKDWTTMFNLDGASNSLFTISYNSTGTTYGYIKTSEFRLYNKSNITITFSNTSTLDTFISCDLCNSSGDKITSKLTYNVTSSSIVVSSSDTVKNIASICINMIGDAPVYNEANFVMRLAIDNMSSFISGISDTSKLTQYGIKMSCDNSSVSDRYYNANNSSNIYDPVNNPSGKIYFKNNETIHEESKNIMYVNISLGDVINNINRVDDEFTFAAYVEYDGKIYSSTKSTTYSLKGLVKAYYDNVSTKAAVTKLYQILESKGVDFGD